MGEVSRIERYTWEMPIRVEWFGLGGSYYLVQFIYDCSVLSEYTYQKISHCGFE